MAKKDRVSKNDHVKLYNELEKTDYYNDTRYFGLFIKEDRICIDPKRFRKKFPSSLNEKMIKVINNRNTHFFWPRKRRYFDYNVNIFIEEINSILKNWKDYYKKQVTNAIKSLKRHKHVPVNDYGLATGIDSYSAASARANWLNIVEDYKYEAKCQEIISSMYAQFFHMMASQIEAVTIKVLNINKVKVNKSLREVIRGTLINKEPLENVKGFEYHDKLYRIWNFIKHNNLDAYTKLKSNYPCAICRKEYESGELAIHYVKFDETLIVSLLEGLKIFFTNYCYLVFDEDVSESNWNYDKFFSNMVYSEIELWNNPLGHDVFSDID